MSTKSNNQNKKNEIEKDPNKKKIYHSFDEYAEDVFNLPSTSLKLRNEGKRKSMQDRFESKCKCKFCGKTMSYIGGNIVCCQNPECDKQSYRLLDESGKQIAQRIYGESGVSV